MVPGPTCDHPLTAAFVIEGTGCCCSAWPKQHTSQLLPALRTTAVEESNQLFLTSALAAARLIFFLPAARTAVTPFVTLGGRVSLLAAPAGEQPLLQQPLP